MVEEDILQKILKTANELSSHNQSVQDLTSNLHSMAADIKNLLPTAAQLDPSLNGTSDEATAGLVIKYAALTQQHQNVVSRNQQLERECGELQALVKEYETNLETIATKLRSHSVSCFPE
ncbi:hypothetical protein EC973_000691 [Apophysomyces ossiformis]|uniref:Uncharacterized protein n=1 Tax=Apophysomyces ossiformis TaxID=679940 RepID=A0A8H7BS25_9FUNG|nr:hypothetical protein EC973_000691 [Apophysomyces ossiformis]